MKGKLDLVSGWLRKARSDLLAMRASAQAGSLDAACFHAQQAAEKHLKAYLVEQDRDIPHTHNLYKLIALCREVDLSFSELIGTAELLTPFAVETRYDTEFWPTSSLSEQAESASICIAKFVTARVQSVSVKIAAPGMYFAWKAARDLLSWNVDLSKFKDAKLYPQFFDRSIGPDQIIQFEDAFRSSLVADGRIERAAEVVYWKNAGNHLARDKLTRRLLNSINTPELWVEFADAVKELSRTPNWESFQRLAGFCGGFATPVTFLSFYAPQEFPMADRRI